MKFTYRPEGLDERSWDIDVKLGTLMNVELIAIEKATGLDYSALRRGLGVESALALTALLWVLRKRTETTLKFDQVQFAMSEVGIEVSDAEALAELAEAEAAGQLPDEGRVMLEELRARVVADPKA